MHHDGPRRKGRFLKANSAVTQKVALSDFRFGDLEEGKSVMADNAIRSIIHAKYHEEEELAHCVVTPPSFSQDLVPAAQRRSVIFPLDFTKDWERARKLTKDRAARQDDDDFDMESQLGTSGNEEEEDQQNAGATAAVTGASATAASGTAPAGTAPAPSSLASATLKEAARAVHDAQGAGTKASAVVAPKTAMDTPMERAPYLSMDVVGKAIKGISPTLGEPEFLPQNVVTAGGNNVASDPEAAPAAQYQNRVAEQLADQEAVQKTFDDAKQGGYQEGFKLGFQEGEVKAELAERQKATAMFAKVAELIQEFSRLKHEILNNVQENFYELCQAMAESLLKREFSIRPEAFVTVLRKAIEEAVEPGKFKIKVHPETFARVEAVCPPDLKASLAKDAEIEPGDFRVESSMSVVNVNVRTMLKELLDQADLNLFQGDQGDTEKAG